MSSKAFVGLGLLLAVIGCLLHIVGLSVVYWVVSDPFISGAGVGLWQECTPNCHAYLSISRTAYLVMLTQFLNIRSVRLERKDYWKSVQVFVLLAPFMGLIGMVMSVCGLTKKSKLSHIFATVSYIVAALCIFLAVIIFAAEYHLQNVEQWGWGFYMTTSSAFIFLAAGFCDFLAYWHQTTASI